jgi:hypothetical protein
MIAITIVREETEGGKEVHYRAIHSAYKAQALGKTAGEALDALTTLVYTEVGDMLVVVPQMKPDEFFTAAQMDRLQELTERSRAGSLTAGVQSERDALIEEELLASAERTACLADSLEQ